MPPTKALFRCLNKKCAAKAQKPPQRNFESTTAVCPHCTAGKDDPRAVREIVYVHYLVNTPMSVGPIKTASGGRMVACMPKATKIPKFAASHPVAVTCPACLASDVLKKHVADKVDQHEPLIEQVITSGQPASNVSKRSVIGRR